MIQNLEKIHPLKRDKVRNGLEYIDKINNITPVVDKVVIFGSVITEYCTDESDIDICLFPAVNVNKRLYLKMRGRLMDKIDDVCDILVYGKLNDEWKQIIRQGIIVYKR